MDALEGEKKVECERNHISRGYAVVVGPRGCEERIMQDGKIPQRQR